MVKENKLTNLRDLSQSRMYSFATVFNNLNRIGPKNGGTMIGNIAFRFTSSVTKSGSFTIQDEGDTRSEVWLFYILVITATLDVKNG